MIRVMLADDQAMVRGALAALLTLESDIQVVAQVGSGDDVLPVALEHRPDVVLMDVDMPGTDGLSATASLLERLPATRVLIVTTFGRPDSCGAPSSPGRTASSSRMLRPQIWPSQCVGSMRDCASSIRRWPPTRSSSETPL